MSGIPTMWPVKYKCGHTEKRDLSKVPPSKRKAAAGSDFWSTKAGPNDDGMVCSKCFKEQTAEDTEKRTRQWMLDIAAFEDEHQLPELTGTDKQISSGLVDSARKDRYTVLTELLDDDNPDQAAQQVIEAARALTRAGWWTNNVGFKTRKDLDYGPEEYAELILDGAQQAVTDADSDRETVTAENPFDWDGDGPDDRP